MLTTSRALGGFAPSPIPEPLEESSLDGKDGDDDNASSSKTDDAMAGS